MKFLSIKLIVSFSLFVSVNVFAETMTICDGRFETGQLVHVKIDWDNKSVVINKFNSIIESAISYGIITESYRNGLGIETFSIIGCFKNLGTFITQQQVQYGQITTTNFAHLYCSNSFYNQFTNKMLDG